jgi:hypothetical protein
VNPRELLDAYAAQDPFDGDCGKFRREEAAQELFVAVRDILDMHAPYDRGAGPKCAGCGTHVTFTPWPCVTVQAITEALEAR